MSSTATYHSLEGRVVVVTGGGQGLGRSYAHHFAEQGAIPVVVDVAADNAFAVADEIKSQGREALAVATNVADESSVVDMTKTVLGKLGRIDCLINNAAILQQVAMGRFWTLDADSWRRVMDVNITGAFLCAKAVAPVMQEARWGRIVNVSSPTVSVGRPNYLHYVTSKSAPTGMTRAMARELGEWNITVNTFWPGVVMTEVERPSVSAKQFEEMTNLQSIKRPATMEDHARAVLFLCSDEAGFITGQSLQSDGGRTFL